MIGGIWRIVARSPATTEGSLITAKGLPALLRGCAVARLRGCAVARFTGETLTVNNPVISLSSSLNGTAQAVSRNFINNLSFGFQKGAK
jgi:hypothetical protein